MKERKEAIVKFIIIIIKITVITLIMVLKPRISAVMGAALSLFVDRKVKGGQGESRGNRNSAEINSEENMILVV